MRYLLPQGNLNLIKEDSSHMVSVDPNMVSSTPNMVSSTPNMVSSDPNMPNPMKKKMSRHELQLLILAHCKEWISLETLSAEISRSPKYLGTYVLPILLASKKLQMLYPGTPKHPKQKYKVAD